MWFLCGLFLWSECGDRMSLSNAVVERFVPDDL